MGILIKNNIKPKNKKDYTNTLKLNIIIIGNTKEKRDNNLNNSNNNKNYKKIKISKSNKYYGE